MIDTVDTSLHDHSKNDFVTQGSHRISAQKTEIGRFLSGHCTALLCSKQEIHLHSFLLTTYFIFFYISFLYFSLVLISESKTKKILFSKSRTAFFEPHVSTQTFDATTFSGDLQLML